METKEELYLSNIFGKSPAEGSSRVALKLLVDISCFNLRPKLNSEQDLSDLFLITDAQTGTDISADIKPAMYFVVTMRQQY